LRRESSRRVRSLPPRFRAFRELLGVEAREEALNSRGKGKRRDGVKGEAGAEDSKGNRMAWKGGGWSGMVWRVAVWPVMARLGEVGR
jgi:hypothetical protein